MASHFLETGTVDPITLRLTLCLVRAQAREVPTPYGYDLWAP